jgi:uncharacterized protein YbaR (Trm112 family)
MVDQELLDILVCPETRQPVRLADGETIERLNAAIGDGRAKNRGGVTLSDPVPEGLVREDGLFVYPIRDDIPIMLIDEAIPVPGTSAE